MSTCDGDKLANAAVICSPIHYKSKILFVSKKKQKLKFKILQKKKQKLHSTSVLAPRRNASTNGDRTPIDAISTIRDGFSSLFRATDNENKKSKNCHK